MENIGFRVFGRIDRPAKSLVDAFAGIPVANIADNMNRMFCMKAQIRPFNETALLGSAFTVKSRIGDNLLLHKAIDLAAPGDVIVIDAQGDTNHALIGELMIMWAQKRGVAGFVVDGAIRDADVVKKLSIPVYAAGVTPAGPYSDGPGEINVPVCCGGVTVKPGDIIAGDSDGIVVIDPRHAPEILEKARQTMKKEAAIMADIKNGTWDRSWVDKKLRDKGYEIIDNICCSDKEL